MKMVIDIARAKGGMAVLAIVATCLYVVAQPPSSLQPPSFVLSPLEETLLKHPV